MLQDILHDILKTTIKTMGIKNFVLNFTSLSFPPSAAWIVWAVFWLILFFSVLYSAILLYHWFKYGRGNKIFSRGVIGIYLGGVIVLLIVMALSALRFTT